MKFKPTSIQILETEPFKWDLLNREDSAKALTDFVGNLEETFVLAIDSPWGSGKTTFLKMWLQYLRNEGFHCLYFNAWENDFSDSPLVSLIGELGTGIDALRLGEKQEATAFKIYEKTKKAGAALLKTALPTAIKVATSGLVDVDLANLAEDIEKNRLKNIRQIKRPLRISARSLVNWSKLFRRKANLKIENR